MGRRPGTEVGPGDRSVTDQVLDRQVEGGRPRRESVEAAVPRDPLHVVDVARLQSRDRRTIRVRSRVARMALPRCHDPGTPPNVRCGEYVMRLPWKIAWRWLIATMAGSRWPVP